ncbi:MAG: DUF1771 domain-containing protein [Candidatus Saccharibacteria bacterium]
MSNDAKLNSLGDTRDRVYKELCSIREEKNRLGKECSRLHDELDEAFKAQKKLYDAQQADWEFHQRVMRDISDKINSYKEESDRYYRQMVEAYQQASAAHDRRDGAAAKSWSETGKGYKSQMESASANVRYHISQSKDSQYRYNNNGNKANFDRAKQKTARLKTEFSEVSARYKPVKAACEEKQAKFNAAKKEFDDHLNWLKKQTEDRKRRLGEVAMRSGYYEKIGLEEFHTQKGRDYQYGDKKSEVYATVKSGWNNARGIIVTDIIVRDKGIPGKHYHLVVGENGEKILSEWRNDPPR